MERRNVGQMTRRLVTIVEEDPKIKMQLLRMQLPLSIITFCTSAPSTLYFYGLTENPCCYVTTAITGIFTILGGCGLASIKYTRNRLLNLLKSNLVRTVGSEELLDNLPSIDWFIEDDKIVLNKQSLNKNVMRLVLGGSGKTIGVFTKCFEGTKYTYRIYLFDDEKIDIFKLKDDVLQSIPIELRFTITEKEAKMIRTLLIADVADGSDEEV
jgi:hypothetical protein